MGQAGYRSERNLRTAGTVRPSLSNLLEGIMIARKAFGPAAVLLLVLVCSTHSFGFFYQLAWDAPASGAAGYNVYRSTGLDGFVKLNSTPVSATSFVDSTAAQNADYVYIVTSVDSTGKESDGSNSVEICTGLRGDINGDTAVDSQDEVVLANYLLGTLTAASTEVNSLRRADMDDSFSVDCMDLGTLHEQLIGTI